MNKEKTSYVIWIIIILFLMAVIFPKLEAREAEQIRQAHEQSQQSVRINKDLEYSEEINYTCFSVFTETILNVNVFTNEALTESVFLTSVLDLTTGTQTISINNGGETSLQLLTATNTNRSGIVVYTELNDYDLRYTYFNHNDTNVKLDWGEHFELLINMNVWFSTMVNDYPEGITNTNNIINNYFERGLMGLIDYSNFIYIKNDNNIWVQELQETNLIGSYVYKDTIKFNIDFDKIYSIGSGNTGTGDWPNGNNPGTGGGFGGGGGGSW